MLFLGDQETELPFFWYLEWVDLKVKVKVNNGFIAASRLFSGWRPRQFWRKFHTQVHIFRFPWSNFQKRGFSVFSLSSLPKFWKLNLSNPRPLALPWHFWWRRIIGVWSVLSCLPVVNTLTAEPGHAVSLNMRCPHKRWLKSWMPFKIDYENDTSCALKFSPTFALGLCILYFYRQNKQGHS